MIIHDPTLTAPKGRVLVVDDDHDLLRLLRLRLRNSGYEVAVADGAEKALVELSVFRPQVVVTDLRMPGMDGMALFHAINQKHPTLPVIILTAHGTIPDAIEATNSGVFSFLTKPFDSQQLLGRIEEALALGGGVAQADGEDKAWREGIVTRSPEMESLLSQAYLVAASNARVFIAGESGTGKELLARAIHRASPRRDAPFVAVNCAAIPEDLLESELFGHVKGAFTGALAHHGGLIQAAQGGTLFLDEVGDMPLALQAKLLRVLEEREVRPVGGTEGVAVDVRIISATNCDIEKEMAVGNFREDLYYRLNVVHLEIPPLARRRQDIPLLAKHFLKALNEETGKRVRGFSREAMELLLSADYPGNVRQLRNVVEQAHALTTTAVIPANLVQKALRGKRDNAIVPLTDAKRRFEKEYLTNLLQITGGNVSQAARLASRNRTEFYKLLHRHDLDPGQFKGASVKS